MFLPQVKARSPRVDMELVRISATAPERALLRCLELLVLGRIAKLVEPDTDVGVQTKILFRRARESAKVAVDGAGASEDGSTIDASAPLDETWRFPNKSHIALAQQAIALQVKHSESGRDSGPGDAGDADTCAGKASEPLAKKNKEVGSRLADLLNLAFAVDELGGDATWRWVLDALETEVESEGEESEDDVDRENTIVILKAHLPQEPATSDSEAETEDLAQTEPNAENEAAFLGSAEGSKLKMVASLLEQHKQTCDKSNARFSALVFVSTRSLALAAPDMLQAMPGLKNFVSAQSIVGLSEMTLAQQATSLARFREGNANVLVSTSVCGEGIDVPACGLVVCTSLPNSGTALVQLRGRIRCGKNSR